MSTSRGRRIPEDPVFATHSERLVWESLSGSLKDGDVLIHGLRFSDAQHGDVEIDVMLLDPQRGIAVVEIKGGTVAFADGEWTTTGSSGSQRRIHPVDQARRAKHSLRRFLDRQIGWPFGLVRSQWMMAFPLTDVTGDMGPQGRRDLIIDRSQTPDARTLINETLDRAVNEPPVPDDPAWIATAVDLLLSAPDASVSRERFHEASHASGTTLGTGLGLAAAALASLAVVGVSVMAAGVWGGIAAALVVVALLAGAVLLLRRRHTVSLATVVGVTLAAGLVGGLIGGLVLRPAFVAWVPASSPGTGQVPQATASPLIGRAVADAAPGECLPDYTPCIPPGTELNCPDIGVRVHLTGDSDPYKLDLDGDKIGCELYPERSNPTPASSAPLTSG